MKLSDMITDMILEMFDAGNNSVQIQRNDLAQRVGCVPSQINYVITSRFTPEQGYQVESRRGGGGCIIITRASVDKGIMIMHTVNSIGDAIDEKTCRAHIYNLNYQGIIEDSTAKLMLAVVNDTCYRELPAEIRNIIRSKLLKQMLLSAAN